MAYRLIGARELSEPIWSISIQPKGTNSSEILIEILIFSSTKMHLKMSYDKWRSICFRLNATMTSKIDLRNIGIKYISYVHSKANVAYYIANNDFLKGALSSWLRYILRIQYPFLNSARHVATIYLVCKSIRGHDVMSWRRVAPLWRESITKVQYCRT